MNSSLAEAPDEITADNSQSSSLQSLPPAETQDDSLQTNKKLLEQGQEFLDNEIFDADAFNTSVSNIPNTGLLPPN